MNKTYMVDLAEQMDAAGIDTAQSLVTIQIREGFPAIITEVTEVGVTTWIQNPELTELHKHEIIFPGEEGRFATNANKQ